jgi:hypothetical protein
MKIPRYWYKTRQEDQWTRRHKINSWSYNHLIFNKGAPNIIYLFIFIIIHLFTCGYIVWVISLPCLLPLPYPSLSPRFQAEPILHFSPVLLKSRNKQ